MQYGIKLHVVSLLYALMLFVPVELVLNVYRISRVTGVAIDTVIISTVIIIAAEMIFGSILFIVLTKKWLQVQKSRYWTIILWAPYFFLLVFSFARLFPMSYAGDMPNPVTGLLAIGALILFPIYILLINFIGKYERS